MTEVVTVLADGTQAAAGGDTTTVLLSTLLGGGGVAVITALVKGYRDLRSLRGEESKVKIENSKAIEEATSSVVDLLNRELKNQAERFNETIQFLETRRQELQRDNVELETRADTLERRVSELMRFKDVVDTFMRQNNIVMPLVGE